MKLKTWQKKQGLSDADLAKKMGISISYLSRLKNNLRRLSPEKAKAVEKMTSGAVTVMELLFPK